MTYNVFGGTLNLAQSVNQFRAKGIVSGTGQLSLLAESHGQNTESPQYSDCNSTC